MKCNKIKVLNRSFLNRMQTAKHKIIFQLENFSAPQKLMCTLTELSQRTNFNACNQLKY